MRKLFLFLIITSISVFMIGCEKKSGSSADSSPNETEISIEIGQNLFTATLTESDTSKAFIDMLPITIDMKELNCNEKYYYLKTNLPTHAYAPINIQKGDIMLFGSNCLVLFYKNFSTSYSYTKIGSINNTDKLATAVGEGDIVLKIALI